MTDGAPLLAGRVAVVAGATRGAGRGIARGLAEAGATVYCTGRSVRGQPSPHGRPETIDETAEMIVAAGGAAIPVRVDHTDESEVEALFAGVEREHGRLDVLVNSIAGEDPLDGDARRILDDGPHQRRRRPPSGARVAHHHGQHAVRLMIQARRPRCRSDGERRPLRRRQSADANREAGAEGTSPSTWRRS